MLTVLPARLPQQVENLQAMEPDRTDAEFLLSLARTGKAEAQLLLGEYFLQRRDYAAAVPWLQRGAEQGDVEAQRRLALLYEAGTGVPRDQEQAESWFRSATKQGDALAFYKGGFCYTTSAGIP